MFWACVAAERSRRPDIEGQAVGLGEALLVLDVGSQKPVL